MHFIVLLVQHGHKTNDTRSCQRCVCVGLRRKSRVAWWELPLALVMMYVWSHVQIRLTTSYYQMSTAVGWTWCTFVVFRSLVLYISCCIFAQTTNNYRLFPHLATVTGTCKFQNTRHTNPGESSQQVRNTASSYDISNYFPAFLRGRVGVFFNLETGHNLSQIPRHPGKLQACSRRRT